MLDSLYLIRLRFTTPLHLGTSRAEYDRAADYLHSDTLYAAIMQAWADLGIEHPALLADQHSNPADLALGFVLSSLFPFRQAQEEPPQYFFPTPTGLLVEGASQRQVKLDVQKKVKKLRFLEASLLMPLLQKGLDADFLSDIEAKIPEGASQFLRPAGGWKKPFYRKETVSRNHVPPTDWWEKEDTVIYYVERLRFDEGAGLFGLVYLEDPKAEAGLRSALRYLQDEGLGSDRHAGHGLFTLDWGPAPEEIKALFKAADRGTHGVNLSLFCPQRSDLPGMIEEEQVRYRLLKRGGWIGHAPYLSLRKDGVYMFEEGGIFHTTAITAGKTVNLRPDLSALGPEMPEVDHPIYRVGRSLFMPINLSDHEA